MRKKVHLVPGRGDKHPACGNAHAVILTSDTGKVTCVGCIQTLRFQDAFVKQQVSKDHHSIKLRHRRMKGR